MSIETWHVAMVIAAAAVLPAAVALYVAGSYSFARSSHAPREWAHTVRKALREGMVVALLQPLLPLYYLIGKTMGGGGGRPVVLVHGYGQNRVDFVWLARALARKGLGPMYGFNYWFFSHIDSSSAKLERFVARVCQEDKCDAVDVVCHSMGGLLAMEMLARNGVQIRRLVTIGTPHAGVTWPPLIPGASSEHLRQGALLVREARALEHATLSIFSTHDNIVHPAHTSSLQSMGGRDLVVSGLGHVSLLFDPVIADEIAAFLAEPASARVES